MDHRCEVRQKVGELRGDMGALLDSEVLTPSQKTRSSPSKNEPFSQQEMHLKIQLLDRGLKCQILNQVVESQLYTSL